MVLDTFFSRSHTKNIDFECVQKQYFITVRIPPPFLSFGSFRARIHIVQRVTLSQCLLAVAEDQSVEHASKKNVHTTLLFTAFVECHNKRVVVTHTDPDDTKKCMGM